jgi:hypothetical protein
LGACRLLKAEQQDPQDKHRHGEEAQPPLIPVDVSPVDGRIATLAVIIRGHDIYLLLLISIVLTRSPFLKGVLGGFLGVSQKSPLAPFRKGGRS